MINMIDFLRKSIRAVIPIVKQVVKQAFRNTYPQNDQKNFAIDDSHHSRFAAFIEIPNWLIHSGQTQVVIFSNDSRGRYPALKEQTAENLAKKFFGWQDNVSTAKKIRNVFLAIFFFVPINLATVLIRTPINIIRLFTEFLPAIVMFATYKKLWDIAALQKKTPGAIVLGVFLGLLHAVAVLMILASSSITNPIRALGRAWSSRFTYEFIMNKKLLVLLGVVLVATTLAFSLIGFTLLAGIPAIQAGVAALLPYVASALPQVIAGLSAVGVFTAKVVSALLWFIPMAGEFLAAGAAAMPALLGIAGLTAVLMPTLGNVISPKIIDFQENWYVSSSKKKNLVGNVEEPKEQTGSAINYKQVHHAGVSMTASRPIPANSSKSEEVASRKKEYSNDDLSQASEATRSRPIVSKDSKQEEVSSQKKEYSDDDLTQVSGATTATFSFSPTQ